MRELPPGTMIGAYRLRRVAGRGAVGIVYEAEHTLLGRVVAVKTLNPLHADKTVFRERFSREARGAASVRHPNIVTVFDAGEHEGHPFLVMGFVDGPDLERILDDRGGRLQPREAVTVCAAVADALDTAGEQGLAHRDVKPANILLEGWEPEQYGGPRLTPHVYLTDFGLIKSSAEMTVTQTGSFVGTLLYMSPEQIQGQAVPASDQYSLACVLWECLTGTPPFDAPDGAALALLNAHLNTPVPPFSEQEGGDWSRELDGVFATALAKNPTARYPTCTAFMSAATSALGLGEMLPPTATAPPLSAFATTDEQVRPAGLASTVAGQQIGLGGQDLHPATAAQVPRGRLGAVVGLVVGALLLVAGAAAFLALRPADENPPPNQDVASANVGTDIDGTPSTQPDDDASVAGGAADDPNGTPASGGTPSAAALGDLEDEGRVAFVGGGDIWVSHVDGSGAANLTQGQFDNPAQPAWRPGTQELVFSTEEGLQLVDVSEADGGTPTPTTLTTDGGHTDPAWSPEGGELIFSVPTEQGRDLAVMGADGQVRPMGLTESIAPDVVALRPTWHPTSGLVAFQVAGSEGTHVWTVDSDGADPVEVAGLPEGQTFHPAWVPGTTDLLFSHLESPDSSAAIVRYSASDESVVMVPTVDVANVRDADPSPCGDWMAVQIGQGDSAEIGVFPFADGSLESGILPLPSGVTALTDPSWAGQSCDR